MKSSDQIKKFILDNLTLHQRDIIHTAIQKFGLSRQAVLKHMNTLIAEKQVVAHGKTRDRFYELRPQVNFSKIIDINADFLPEEILPYEEVKKSVINSYNNSLKDEAMKNYIYSIKNKYDVIIGAYR